MNNRQNSYYEAGKRVQGLWVTYPTELNSDPDLVAEKANLDTEITQMESAAIIQATDNTGVASGKQAFKDKMITTVIKFALRAKVKAHRAGNTSLEQELNHPKSYYNLLDSETSLARASATKDKIKNNLATLTNITDADITEMEKTITDFQNVIAQPTAIKQAKKVGGTNQIELLVGKVIETIINIGDLIHSYFADTLLSQEFDAKSKLGATVNRHNHLILMVEDAETNAPIAVAKATNTKTNTTTAANTDGQILYNTIRAGKQQFTIEANGYTAQTINVNVQRSTATEVVVEMDKS